MTAVPIIGVITAEEGPLYVWLQEGSLGGDAGYSLFLCNLSDGCHSYQSHVSSALLKQQEEQLDHLLDITGSQFLFRLKNSIQGRSPNSSFSFTRPESGGGHLAWNEKASDDFQVELCNWDMQKAKPSGQVVAQMLQTLCEAKRELMSQRAATDEKANIMSKETVELTEALSRLRRKRKVELENIKQQLVNAINEVKDELRNWRKRSSEEEHVPALVRSGSLTRKQKRELEVQDHAEVQDRSDSDELKVEADTAKRRKLGEEQERPKPKNASELSMLDELEDL